MDKPGGVPTSHVKTGQQWDYSNAWPPLQHVVISSLEAVGEHMAAKQLASKWIYNNYRQEFFNFIHHHSGITYMQRNVLF